MTTRLEHMRSESFSKALEAVVNDSDAAAAIAGGDFGHLGKHDLTADEQALLQAAADEIPDVSGFGSPPISLGYIGETEKNVAKLNDALGRFGPRFREAAQYLQYELHD